MKKILFSAAMALVLVSCSRDEVIEINRDSDEIRFGVVTDAATRAADVYCNNNLPGAFNVWATYNNGATNNGATYIDGDLIQKDGTAWVNKTGVRYWPQTGNVTFYAQVNAGAAFKWNDGAPTIENYTVDTDVTKQNDLLYAVKSQGRSDNPVILNFRHALSQIVFQARNTNANLYVEIKGVTICKLGNVNTFTYNSADTDENIENHEGTTVPIDYDESWGTWGPLKGGSTNYHVELTEAVPVPGDGADKSLTNTNNTGKEFSSNAMLLLPQTTTAWDPGTDNGIPGKQNGTYFLVDCKICNIAGASYDPATDVVLWNGNAAVPVAFNWEQGKKYIYTFVFGNGNGGYDPEPGPDPNPDPTPDPEPVLIPITFEVTVDDFVPVTNQDIAMETNK